MSRPVRACLLVGLVTTSVIAGVLLSELILRLVGYTAQVKIHDRHILIPQFYFKADPLNGYDIADNFPDAPFNFSDYIRIHGAPFMISSNNLGCRDQSFDQEGDYVLLIGDSFTWGYAPLEQTWGAVLEQFAGMRVLKCGVWGYGTRQELGKLEAVVARAGRPRLVIVGYFVGNDLLDDYLYPQITVVDGHPATMVELVDVKRGGRKFLSEDEQQERHRKFLERKVAGEQKPSGFADRTKDFFSYHSVLYDLFRQFRDSGSLRRMVARLGLVEPPSPLPLSPELAIFQPIAEAPWLEQAWKEHFANLRHLKSAVEAEGATMLVVMFPSNVQVDKYLRPQERDLQWEYPNQRLIEFFQQEHIAFLDLLPEFQRHVRLPGRLNWASHNDLYWPHDSHPNVTGNRLAGLLVAEHLLQSSYHFLSEEGTRLSDVKKRLVELTQMPR